MTVPDHSQRNPESVRKMFARIAPHYDKVNRAMCFGMDIRWRKILASDALKRGVKPLPILDLACGSGDIAIEILKREPDAKVTACDLCEAMLKIAKEKAEIEGIEPLFVCADAEHLPFENSAFGACTIGFGFRNFADRKKCLLEIARVLAPGGGLFILEVARANKWLEFIQNFFMASVVPNIAALFGGCKEDYRYLAKTTRAFPRKAELEALICASGFERVSTKKFAFGFVAITKAFKK